MDNDEEGGPIRAISEASRVVAEHQSTRITGSRLVMDDLEPRPLWL